MITHEDAEALVGALHRIAEVLSGVAAAVNCLGAYLFVTGGLIAVAIWGSR